MQTPDAYSSPWRILTATRVVQLGLRMGVFVAKRTS